ncbi:MAG TPA: hypothetical protein VMQ93_11870, partial [Novosphingobium sp.]|nr:hypothetical protein [Novosphingobium sp.]
MRNSASALALQLCLDFDQPVRPPDPAPAVAPDAAIISQHCEPTLFSLAPAEVLAGQPPVEPIDFSFAAGRMLASSWKGRAQDNVEAIRLLNLLDREQRGATPAEQEAIAKFIGFGA